MQLTLPRRHKALAIFLIVALLATQWVGLKHRVVHGSGSPSTKSSNKTASSFVVNWDDQVNHSCAAFEAAAVAAAVATPCFTLPVVPNTHVLALWVAFASWQAPHISHFSSRAPPA